MLAYDISWDDLRIFLEVGRHKTLSAAAKQLGVDDSTVSRRMAQLETNLGETVFVRGRNGFQLTAKGSELLGCVQDMESSALAIMESRASSDRRNPRGRVRLATMEGIATLYLAGEFVRMRDRHPDLEIELITSSQAVNVSRREADLFLSFFRAEGRGLRVEPIGQFDLHLYGEAEYLQRHGKPKSIDDLSKHVFASYVDDLVHLDSVRWLREVAADLKVVFHSSSMLAQMSAAAAGVGLVMLPTFAHPERFGLQRVLDEQTKVNRVLWLTVHQDLEYTPRVRAVVDYLRMIMLRDYPYRG
jgi:DNA-binding transcriptional LysR family regulator